jgi:hypothetical protein
MPPKKKGKSDKKPEKKEGKKDNPFKKGMK